MPAFGEPGVTVPDDGTRPLGESSAETPVTNPETAGGPLADQINDASIEVAQLAEETTAAEEEWLSRTERLTEAAADWSESADALEAAQSALDLAAGQAYTDMSGVPDTELPDLTGLTPLGSEWDLPGLAEAVDDAETAESVAHAAYDAAAASASRAEGRYTALNEAFTAAQAELDQLIADNAEELEEIERAREEAAAEYSDDFSSEVDGWDAAPEAKEAVEYALAQLGKPYEWGAEGPDTFDCSGLTQSAYAYAGVTIPRVAADQFNFTRDKPVDTEMLLPGDLLFWWDSPGEWQSVYHVGMYLGDGKMVQAPRTGDVVKISSIWFENFAGAHRVVDAIQTDGGDDNDEPSGGGGPSGDDGTSDEPDPSPTDGETLDPDPGPSTSPTPDDEPTPDDDPTPSPDEPTPTEDESPDEPTPSASDPVSGTLSREPETGETSGELSEGGYRGRGGDGTMVASPLQCNAPSPRRLPWTTTAVALAVSA